MLSKRSNSVNDSGVFSWTFMVHTGLKCPKCRFICKENSHSRLAALSGCCSWISQRGYKMRKLTDRDWALFHCVRLIFWLWHNEFDERYRWTRSLVGWGFFNSSTTFGFFFFLKTYFTIKYASLPSSANYRKSCWLYWYWECQPPSQSPWALMFFLEQITYRIIIALTVCLNYI